MPRNLLAAACLCLLVWGTAGSTDIQTGEPLVHPDGLLELQPAKPTSSASATVPAFVGGIPLLFRPLGNPLRDAPSLHTVKAYYVGYAPDSLEAVRRYASAVDIVAGQWLSVNAAGQIAETPDHARNDEVRRIVRCAGGRVYTCVVNAHFDRAVLSAVLHSRERRQAVIRRLVAFVERKGDDGIDLDFEGMRPGHRDGYTAFVKELATELHARGKELSLAVDIFWDGSPSPACDYRILSRYADSIMPMTYTFGPGAVPIAPIDYLERAAAKGIAQMEPSQFMIGMGVYARDCNRHTGRITNLNMAKVRSLAQRYAPQVVFDPDTLTKKFSYQDEKGHRHVVFFDDADTIAAKLARLSRRYQIGAVGFWRMGHEDPVLWDLVRVASLRGRSGPHALLEP